MTLVVRGPHALVGALCVGVASANAARLASPLLAFVSVAALLAAVFVRPGLRLPLAAAALALAGWWWGSVRLDRLDRSVLAARIGTAERALVEVDAPVTRTEYGLRAQVIVRRFGDLRLREPALLELPLGRAPPLGARLALVATVDEPRGPVHGFDERAWLRRKGVHVVLHASRWARAGSRGGVAAIGDRVRARVERPLRRVGGERSALLVGIVLGDDQAVPKDLRDRFRKSGLYHLLAVSGQNVALVAVGALMLAWTLGVPRWVGELGALAGIAGYVLAVGPQPSVLRAGLVGALGSLAWLAARQRDRWHFLLLAAFALLAWNPYTLLDAGFQLSFAAVSAIFLWVRPLLRFLEGYPVPRRLAEVLAVSAVCGVATAPILWLQFHALPLLAVPANALAAPAMAPLLAFSLLAGLVDPLVPALSALLVWLAAWCAAWIALCARLVGGLPFAQIRSNRGGAALAACALLGGAYAWRRWRPSSRSI